MRIVGCEYRQTLRGEETAELEVLFEHAEEARQLMLAVQNGDDVSLLNLRQGLNFASPLGRRIVDDVVVDVGRAFRRIQAEFVGHMIVDDTERQITDALRSEGVVGMVPVVDRKAGWIDLRPAEGPEEDPYRSTFNCRCVVGPGGISDDVSNETQGEETDMPSNQGIGAFEAEANKTRVPAIDQAPDEVTRGMRSAAARQVFDRVSQKVVAHLEEHDQKTLAGFLQTDPGRIALAAVLSTALDFAPFRGRRKELAGVVASEMRVSSYSDAGYNLFESLGSIIEGAFSDVDLG